MSVIAKNKKNITRIRQEESPRDVPLDWDEWEGGKEQVWMRLIGRYH